MPKRFGGVIRRVGESISVAGSATEGIVMPLSTEEATMYLTAAELASLGRPLWLAYLPHDIAATPGNECEWNAQTASIQKVIELRYCGATISKLAVMG